MKIQSNDPNRQLEEQKGFFEHLKRMGMLPDRESEVLDKSVKSPEIPDRESEVLDQIRLLFRKLDPVKQAGLVSELSRTVSDN